LADRLVVPDLAAISPRSMLIGGELVDSGDGEMPVISPADGSSLGHVPVAGPKAVAAAVEAAEDAFPAWRATNLRQRQAALVAMADYLARDLDELAVLDAIDGGLTLSSAQSNVRVAEAYVRYFAGLAYSWGGRSVPVVDRAFDFTVRKPIGPTARIIAFNHPVMFAAWKIAAPLLVGNTIVLKLPDQAPLSGLRLGNALREIFPPGVVNVITGPGHLTGDALVRHPGIKRVAFIGSVATGRRILAAVAARNVPVTAELGGKNAHIVAADADLDRAARIAVDGMSYSGAGQSCGSYSRVLVHESVHDEVVERIAALTGRLKVGHPLDPAAQVGPLIGPEPVERALAAVRHAAESGARVVLGGTAPASPECAGGYYMNPTVLADVDPEMGVAQDELFAPVQTIMRWSTPQEAVDLANATEFGLCASIHTNDLRMALTMADEIEVGSVSINGGGSQHWMGAPFGGCKASGAGGKEDSIDELLDATYERNIYVSMT
jgi:betaine-aldehyde dehydrogenase